MKSILTKATASLMVLGMLTGCTSAAPEQTAQTPEPVFDETAFIDWYNSSQTWATMETGHYSKNPEDQMSDEEIKKVLSMAMTVGTGRSKSTPTYFVVVKDVNEQMNILGDDWQKKEDKVSEGTVMLLEYVDCLLTEEEGHVTPYQGAYSSGNMALFAAGQTAQLVSVAASTLGYYSHIYGGFYGEYAPYDIADGKYASLARYLSEDDTRVIGHDNVYGSDEILPETIVPVLGNCVLVTAIVLGKPADGEDLETFATRTGRPNNYKFWDGTVNESAAKREPETKEEEQTISADTEISLEDNQYLGEADGMDDTVKVRITVEDGKLTNVEVVYANETPNIGTKAIDELPSKILEAQSADVDVVTGATVTSDAIKEAVHAALKEAGLE